MLWWLAACTPKTPPAAQVRAEGRSELVLAGSVEQRVSDLDADLVVFYGGELVGNLGTCGCGQRPRGGLGRVAEHVRANERRGGAEHLLLFAGRWLDDHPDAGQGNALMLEALDALDVDAATLTHHDLAALEGDWPEWAIATNVEGAPRSRIFDVDGRRVAVVAVGARGSVAHVNGKLVEDPVESTLEVLEDLDADTTILMTWGMPEKVSLLASQAEVDVIIDAAEHRGFFKPVQVDETVVVRAQYETTRLGELRIDWERGVLVDRQIDLGEDYPEAPDLKALREAADALR